ncbi:MAG: pyruvate kinase [Clostridia bacterium]|nr:pyruvate kinase [Clostridia bacterium]
MRKTKIVCTIGPACRNVNTLRDMVKAGMSVARLNFSHGDHEYHRETIEMLRQVRKELDVPLGILLDTKGPEIRTRDFINGYEDLEEGQLFTFTIREVEGNKNICQVTFDGFAKSLKMGDTVLVDDGKIRMTVEESNEEDVVCRVLNSGRIANHKGINVPNVHMDIPALGPTDKADLLFGVQMDVDFVAASFIRNAQDVVDIRKYLNYYGGHHIAIISKIENAEGIDNFEEILEKSDGIMVARGDMGVEVEYTRLPGIQKKLIRTCYKAGKMVITATQMLESMSQNPTPTRAEITDVANAVFDGTSAVMLSGETAAGKYPVQAVRTMAYIAQQAEMDAKDLPVRNVVSYDTPDGNITNAVCDAACRAARDLDAKAIVALTKSGSTARNVSKFRPAQPIVAATPDVKTYHQLALSWGVFPVISLEQREYQDLLTHAVDCAKQIDMVDKGDVCVIVAGMPLGLTGNTNVLQVNVVE